MSDAEQTTRPMTPDELEANGYPRDFHDLSREDKDVAEAARQQALQAREHDQQTAQQVADTADGLAGAVESPVPNTLEADQLYDLHGELEGVQVRIIELRTGDNALVEFTKDVSAGLLIGTRTLFAVSVLANVVSATEATVEAAVEPAPPEAP